MKLSKIVHLLIFFILTVSCSRKNTFPIHINLDHAIENDDPTLYEALSPILSNGIAVAEKHIVAYDPESATLDLYDKAGNFLNHIAYRGLGHGEFDGVFSVSIDERHNKVFVLDWRALHSYTLSGVYLKTIHLSSQEPDGFAVSENGTIIIHHGETDAETSYTVLDTLGTIQYEHSNTFQIFPFEFNPFYKTNYSHYLYEGHIHVKDINDTIFRFQTGRLTPRYVFTGHRALASKEMINTNDFKQAYRMSNLAETQDFLVFETNKNGVELAKKWSYHKQTEKLYYSLSVEKKVASIPVLKKVSDQIVEQNDLFMNFTLNVNGVSIIMIAIPKGSFERKNFPDPDFSTHKRYTNEVSNVQLHSFYIAETEVTQELWKAVMGSYHTSYDGYDLKPVNNVSWIGAVNFIKELNMLTGKSFRLPYEAEWEYAAGGPQPHLSKWAGTNQADELSKYAHFMEGKGSQASVKSKMPNQFGLYDMTGNVCEWCMDWYADYPDTKTSVDPQGEITGRAKVIKGRWIMVGDNLERPYITDRRYMPLHVSNHICGFRLAMSVQ